MYVTQDTRPNPLESKYRLNNPKLANDIRDMADRSRHKMSADPIRN